MEGTREGRPQAHSSTTPSGVSSSPVRTRTHSYRRAYGRSRARLPLYTHTQSPKHETCMTNLHLVRICDSSEVEPNHESRTRTPTQSPRYSTLSATAVSQTPNHITAISYRKQSQSHKTNPNYSYSSTANKKRALRRRVVVTQ